jgi:hypothetical protein
MFRHCDLQGAFYGKSARCERMWVTDQPDQEKTGFETLKRAHQLRFKGLRGRGTEKMQLRVFRYFIHGGFRLSAVPVVAGEPRLLRVWIRMRGWDYLATEGLRLFHCLSIDIRELVFGLIIEGVLKTLL